MIVTAFLVILFCTLCLRINFVSGGLLFLLLWASPLFLIEGPAGIIYIFAATWWLIIAATFNIRASNQRPHINSRYSNSGLVLLTFFLLIILILDSGFGGFLSGKYGDVPGGNIILYYFYNSALYLTCVIFIWSDQKTKMWIKTYLFILILLMVVNGDRTIALMVLFSYLICHYWGKVPLLSLLRFRQNLLAVILLVGGFISKSLYSDYSAGNFGEASINEIFIRSFTSFEILHNFSILNSTIEYNLEYDFLSYISEFLGFFPGSSFLSVDIHEFSTLLKTSFFSSWGLDSGVGAQIYAQHYAVFGFLGIAGFVIFHSFGAVYLQRLSRSSNQFVSSLMIVFFVPLFFYIYRNGMGSILSFCGRYLLILFIIFMISNIRTMFLGPKTTVSRPQK